MSSAPEWQSTVFILDWEIFSVLNMNEVEKTFNQTNKTALTLAQSHTVALTSPGQWFY